jgi:hypothetical protein
LTIGSENHRYGEPQTSTSALVVASLRRGSTFDAAVIRPWIDRARVSPFRESLQSAVGSSWMSAFMDGCSPGWVADIHLPFSLYPLLLLP